MNPTSFLLMAMMVSCVYGQYYDNSRDDSAPDKELAQFYRAPGDLQDSMDESNEDVTTEASAQNFPDFGGPDMDYHGGNRGNNYRQQNQRAKSKSGGKSNGYNGNLHQGNYGRG
ncbi:hypothetical protein HDE_10018 [Halotydeus destructor]|nr:hypothetical protein HDE_10018 [Halotydeus destructor]